MGIFDNFGLVDWPELADGATRAKRVRINRADVEERTKQVLYLAIGIMSGQDKDLLRDNFRSIFDVTDDKNGLQIFYKRMRDAKKIAMWLKENDVKLIKVR